jgi:RES domain-containing protein
VTEIAYRIVKSRVAGSIDEMFSGIGAALHGGRWNTRGVHMVYASETKALATLELAVHLNNTAVLTAYNVCRVEIPNHLCEEVGVHDLPEGWDELVINPLAAQSWGDLWIATGATPVVKVPSVLMPSEWNFLINPEHDDFDQITFGTIESFPFDGRIKGNPLK